MCIMAKQQRYGTASKTLEQKLNDRMITLAEMSEGNVPEFDDGMPVKQKLEIVNNLISDKIKEAKAR